MKNLFLSFLAFVSISTFTYAQETANTASAQSKTEVAASKESGNFKFILPSGLTSEDVTNNAKYYVHYFSVNYSDKTQEANISMVTNDDKSRYVIMRFLTACGVRYVKMDGATMSLEDFFSNHIK